MPTTRQTAAIRIAERKQREARQSAAFRWQETALLLVTSLFVGFGLWLVWSAKAQQMTAAQGLDLNSVKSPQEILPLLNFISAPDERDFIAHRIFAARGRKFANAGAIGNIRVTGKEIAAHPQFEDFKKRLVDAEGRQSRRKQRLFGPEPGPASVSLLTPDQIRQLKPSVSVRSPSEYKRAFLLWPSLCLAAFWVIHLVWRFRGFSGDNVLLPIVQLLSGTGLILMVSLRDPLRDTLMFQDFAQGILIGCVCLLAASLFDYERELRGLSYVWLGVSVALAIALALFGTGPGESDAKVNLFFFQPVEVIRITLVLFLAGYFARSWDALRDLKQQRGLLAGLASRFSIPRLEYVLPVGIGVGVAVAMFFLLKDLGPALVIGALFLTLYSVARNRVGLAIAGLAAIIGVFWFAHTLGYPETVSQRIAMRASPWDNYVRGGDQLAHSLWALASGGVLGQGIGMGSPEYVPAAHTDLVVSALGEEWGYAGLLAVYLLYAVLLYRSLRIALRAQGVYSFFLVVGLTMVTALQILLITGGLLGVIPLSGVVSPFLSYGRSSMAANFALFGIILAVSNRARGNQSARFGTTVAFLGYGLGFVFVVLMGRAAFIQIRDADDIAARAALVVQAAGPRQYEYNPRLTQLARTIGKGEIFDRNGIPLASSKWDQVEAHRKDYETMGIALDKTPPAQHRFYPLGPKLFYLLGDVQSTRKRGAPNTSFQERVSRVRLQGFDDYAELEISKDAKTGQTIRRIRYDYRDLMPLLRHRYEPENPAVRDILDRNRDVKMSIDARLQMRASAILEQHLRALGKDRGSIVILDPDNGDTLAAVSYPWPAPAQFASLSGETPSLDVNDDQLQDRVRYGLYPPGSSFKLVTAIAALRKDPSLAHQKYNCIRLPDGRAGNYVGKSKRPIRDDVMDRNPHGTIDMEHGIVVSCNAYFAQLGAYNVGAKGLFDTAALFGIQTASPNKPEKLREVLPQASYGQGQVVVSPFQMARVAATVANGGAAPQGRWVIDESNSRTRDAIRVLPANIAQELGGFMHEVVTSGTGRVLAKSPVPIAGKTGTAELATAPSHAWFIGYAPYGSAVKRRIAFAVLVENGQYGGTAAAPIAGEIVAAARDLGIIEGPK